MMSDIAPVQFGAYLGLDDASPGKDGNHDRLPEGEEDDCFYDDKLGEGADGGELLLGGHEHEDEAVQGPQLTEVVHKGGVQVDIVQPQLALLVNAALLRDECCNAMFRLDPRSTAQIMYSALLRDEMCHALHRLGACSTGIVQRMHPYFAVVCTKSSSLEGQSNCGKALRQQM